MRACQSQAIQGRRVKKEPREKHIRCGVIRLFYGYVTDVEAEHGASTAKCSGKSSCDKYRMIGTMNLALP
jgi:hypothetical protein